MGGMAVGRSSEQRWWWLKVCCEQGGQESKKETRGVYIYSPANRMTTHGDLPVHCQVGLTIGYMTMDIIEKLTLTRIYRK